MTAKELAIKLNGREVGNEITRREAQEAVDAGLVVLYGYSDDNAAFVSTWTPISFARTADGQ